MPLGYSQWRYFYGLSHFDLTIENVAVFVSTLGIAEQQR